MSEIYTAPQEVHTAKKLSQKVVGLMQSKPEEGETAEVLALFFDTNDVTAAEDRWLNGVIQAAYDGGFATRALNDGLVEIDLSEGAAEPEPEEKPTPTKAVAKKTVAKKAAARPAPKPDTEEADTEVPAEVEAELEEPPATPAASVPTREELEEMEPSEVKEVAASLGIVLPPRTRATTYIDHILGEAKAPAPTAEVSEVPEVAEVDIVSTNGHLDADALAERVADILWERWSERLTKALA
jgi:hypothetical protein